MVNRFDFAEAADRALRRCEMLADFSEEAGRITRTFLSPPMHDVHRTVREWMEAAGLTVRVDALGTIVGESDGGAQDSDTPVLLLGSHLDTVRNAGRYDGILGVLLAIEAADVLRNSDKPLPFALHVVGFSEEEGVRFPPYISSRAVAGTFDPALLELRDDAGKTLREAIVDFGLDPTKISEAAYPSKRSLIGYVEVHIEQGPRLENADLPVAAVDVIAGQSRLLLRIAGQAGHAGTCPMPLRRDALAGASELILAIESLARATDGLVATVGFIQSLPNVSNVIPGEVELSLDMRHKEDPVRLNAVAELKQRAEKVASARGLRFSVERERHFSPVPMDTTLTGAMQSAVRNITGIDIPPLTSGAGHDAAIMAEVMPATMLFLRSLNGGISHHPDESVSPSDVETALRVLVRFIEGLAESHGLALPTLSFSREVQEAFFDAIYRGDCFEVRKRLADGVSPNARNNEGESALVYAASHGRDPCVEALMEYGADCTILPMADAAVSPDPTVMRRFLAMGGDPNASEKGQTPLMEAANWGNIDTIRLLLEHGAAPLHRANGMTARAVALQYGHNAVAALLQEAEENRGGA